MHIIGNAKLFHLQLRLGNFSLGIVIFFSKQIDIASKRYFCMVFYLMVNELNVSGKRYTVDTDLVFLAK